MPSVYSPMWTVEEKPAVTLPVVALSDGDEARREAAEHIATTRTIRAGLDAWQAIGNAESFQAWKHIGAALSIGKQFALRASGANAAWGQNYSRAFNGWLKEHRFDNMPKPARSVAIEMHENIHAIEAWRNALPEKRRRRLVHPLSVTRRWRKETQPQPRQVEDAVKSAAYAWRHFVGLMEGLPPEQAAPLWQTAYMHAMKSKRIQYVGSHRCSGVKIFAIEASQVHQI